MFTLLSVKILIYNNDYSFTLIVQHPCKFYGKPCSSNICLCFYEKLLVEIWKKKQEKKNKEKINKKKPHTLRIKYYTLKFQNDQSKSNSAWDYIPVA